MKTKITKFQIAMLCIAGLLTAFGVIETIIHIKADVPTSKTIIMCLSYLAILYYGAYGYKVPHGNTLKYIIFFFALILVNELALESGGKYPGLAPETTIVPAALTGFCIIFASYVSGRLHKFNRNIYLCSITLALLVVRALLMSGYRTIMFADFSDVIIWFDIVCVYAVRYNQHKEAGLETK